MKIMKCYHFTVEAVRPRFMEPGLNDTMEHHVVANSLEDARNYIYGFYDRGGWTIKGMSITETNVVDIRK